MIDWIPSILFLLFQDFAKSVASNATSEVLKYTALTGIVSAVALPVGLLQMCNMIDGPWTLAIERSDEAGIELAVSLMESRTAGHRPVSLVGYSFGARVIYACLLELSRHQKRWEVQHQRSKNNNFQQQGKFNEQKGNKNGKQSTSEEIDISNYNPSHYYREPASIIEDVILMGW